MRAVFCTYDQPPAPAPPPPPHNGPEASIPCGRWARVRLPAAAHRCLCCPRRVRTPTHSHPALPGPPVLRARSGLITTGEGMRALPEQVPTCGEGTGKWLPLGLRTPGSNSAAAAESFPGRLSWLPVKRVYLLIAEKNLPFKRLEQAEKLLWYPERVGGCYSQFSPPSPSLSKSFFISLTHPTGES